MFAFNHSRYPLARRKWQPTPVFLPGKSQGQGSLVGCHLWGHAVGHDWSDLAAAAAAVNFMTRACHDPICRKSQGIHSDIAKTKRQVLQSHRTQTSTKQLWRHETRRRLLPGQKAMTNLDSVLKSRDITLPTKVHIAKAMVFPVVTYSWLPWESASLGNAVWADRSLPLVFPGKLQGTA